MADKEQEEITIYYDETADYRVIRADGAWAGITPQLEIQFALYNEIQPLPETVRHKITPEGNLGQEVDRQAEVGIKREVSAMVVMNPLVMMQFIQLLQRMLGRVGTQIKDIPQAQELASQLMQFNQKP